MSNLENRRRFRTPKYDMSTSSIDIKLGDCHDLIKAIPDQSIDFIVSDPPYGVTAAKWDQLLNYEVLWPEFRRIIKPGGRIAIFSAQPFTTMLIASNIAEFRHVWYWRKSRPTGHLRSSHQPLRAIEEIAVFGTKAESGVGRYYNPQKTELENPYRRNTYRKPSDLYKKSVWNREHDVYVKEYTHAHPTNVLEFASDRPVQVSTQKPLKLLEYLITTHSMPGDTVFDPTVGSGTAAVAAQNLGRNFIGFEQDPKHFEIATNRVQNNSTSSDAA